MTLFGAANVYAPGEAGTPPDLGHSAYQNMTPLGRYDLRNLRGSNLLIAVVGLVALAWLAHRWLR